MATKLITLTQLKTVVDALKSLISGKASLNGTPTFTSVTVGGTTIASDSNGNATVTPTGGSSMRVVVENDPEQHAVVDYIKADKLYDYDEDKDGSSYRVYAFPHSSSAAVAEALGEHGAGVIHTSDFHAMRIYERTIPSPSSQVMRPGIYNIVRCAEGLTEFNLYFKSDGTSFVDEWWVDLYLGTIPIGGITSQTIITPVDVHVVSDYPLFWAGGEPSWIDLVYKRIQIHVVNDVATYVIVDDSEDNLDNA